MSSCVLQYTLTYINAVDLPLDTLPTKESYIMCTAIHNISFVENTETIDAYVTGIMQVAALLGLVWGTTNYRCV